MIRWLCLRSDGLFGDFKDYKGDNKPVSYYSVVMARSEREAAARFMKRTHATKDLSRFDGTPEQTSENFGKVKIMPALWPFERFVTYWG